jgi:amidase
VGPIARTVKDAARLLQVIAGRDSEDSYTLLSPHCDRTPDYIAACIPNGLQGKRIGVPRNVINVLINSVSYMMPAFEIAIASMKKAGAIIVEDTNYTAFSPHHRRQHNPIPQTDFVRNLEQYLSKVEKNPQNINNIHDLRTWTQNYPEEEYPRRDTTVWDSAIESGVTQGSAEFHALYEENLYLGGDGGVLGALDRHSLDAIILPSKIAFSRPALVGSPIITVPLGVTPIHVPVELEDDWDVVETGPGIPFGISFLGRKWDEETLIECAFSFEQATVVRETLERVIVPSSDLDNVFGRDLAEAP